MTAGGPSGLDLGTLAVVGAVILVLVAVQWWLKSRARAPDGPIRVVATQPLGAKRALAVVEVDEERFLLGLSEARIDCLGRLQRRGAGETALRAVAGLGAVS
jgi:flagellar biogenesis protein FliO